MISPSSNLNCNGGFFSCCSVILHSIVDYINANKKYPVVDLSDQFNRYKPSGMGRCDMSHEYFSKKENVHSESNLPFIKYHENYQYLKYKELDYDAILPVVKRYFSPSDQINQRIAFLESKYGLDDYSSICVLFYRGNDKSIETNICEYTTILQKAKEVQRENPSIRFLIQSDETEFIDYMMSEFPGSIYFKDEIRHMTKRKGTVDDVFRDKNYEFSKYYLAITHIMAKCGHVVCGSSGNCSIWIAFFRGNADNFHQYKSREFSEIWV